MLKYSKFAAKMVALVISKLRWEAKPGLTGKDLEQIAISVFRENKLKSSSLNYGGFPASICVSLNNELTHGIPTDVPFKHGDLVSVDVACSYRGFHADAASTFIIEGEDHEVCGNDNLLQKKMLLEVTENSLMEVIRKIVPTKTTTSEIGSFIESYVKKHGFFVIKEFGGHGIGKMLHMDPFIPNFGRAQLAGVVTIKPGMLICIEPLVQVDNDLIKMGRNGITIESFSGSLNAHFEHTILIREKDVEILTVTEDPEEHSGKKLVGY